MNFWDRALGKNEIVNQSDKTDSHFDKYRSELNELGLNSMDDLEKLVRPLIRKTTKIELVPSLKLPKNSQLSSHFGGQPYFEKGESWPKSKSGKPMDFLFQIFNEDDYELPQEIKLIQFYYDWDEFPWDTENGWEVKIYKILCPDKEVMINKPNELEKSKFCKLNFKSTYSLPDWEGISTFDNNALKLSCVLDEDEPWDSYSKTIEKLIGKQQYQSQLGGYPNWVQGESTPRTENGDPMTLLFQIDSEVDAGLMWGDVGLIYVFYDSQTGKTKFILQCH